MPPEAGLFLALERCWLTSVTPSRSRHARCWSVTSTALGFALCRCLQSVRWLFVQAVCGRSARCLRQDLIRQQASLQRPKTSDMLSARDYTGYIRIRSAQGFFLLL